MRAQDISGSNGLAQVASFLVQAAKAPKAIRSLMALRDRRDRDKVFVKQVRGRISEKCDKQSDSSTQIMRSPEPSAPPIHMMPDSDHPGEGPVQAEQSQQWGPPPRYEEAIADDQHLASTTGLAAQSSNIDLANQRRSPTHGRNNPDTQGQRQRPTSSLTHRNIARSASPDGLCGDDGDQSASQERISDCDAGGKKKKRSPVAKIKKGLENIAFFVIQILD